MRERIRSGSTEVVARAGASLVRPPSGSRLSTTKPPSRRLVLAATTSCWRSKTFSATSSACERSRSEARPPTIEPGSGRSAFNDPVSEERGSHDSALSLQYAFAGEEADRVPDLPELGDFREHEDAVVGGGDWRGAVVAQQVVSGEWFEGTLAAAFGEGEAGVGEGDGVGEDEESLAVLACRREQ